jgi:hypothetical protein
VWVSLANEPENWSNRQSSIAVPSSLRNPTARADARKLQRIDKVILRGGSCKRARDLGVDNNISGIATSDASASS